MNINNIKLTAEEKKLLKANAGHLSTAYKADYTLPLYQRDLIALNALYSKYINKQGVNIGCPRCILKLLKALYPLAEVNKLL